RLGIGVKPARVDEIDRVDAVAATAFGIIKDISEDRETTEVGVLADLVRRQAELGDVKTGDGCRQVWALCGKRLGLGSHDLRASADDDPRRLRIGSGAGIACRVE